MRAGRAAAPLRPCRGGREPAEGRTRMAPTGPEPGRRLGEWTFTLTPARPGDYRVFADFTPAAT